MKSHLKVSVSQRLQGKDGIEKLSLCEECQTDLRTNRRKPAPKNLSYRGPWMVRSEKGYHVATLPNAIYVHVGSLRTLKLDDLKELRSDAINSLQDENTLTFSSSEMDIEQARETAHALQEDPVESVQVLGKKIEEEILKHAADQSRSPDV